MLLNSFPIIAGVVGASLVIGGFLWRNKKDKIYYLCFWNFSTDYYDIFNDRLREGFGKTPVA